MRNIIWRNRASAILGLLVVFLPFTGFPESVQTIFFIILGALIALFGFTSNHYASELGEDSEEKKFVESKSEKESYQIADYETKTPEDKTTDFTVDVLDNDQEN